MLLVKTFKLKTQGKKDITAMKQSYYIKHDMLPNEDDNKDYKMLLQEDKFINKLLTHDNFNCYLIFFN